MDMIMGKRYYIAYGSNLNVEQMKRRCPSARIVGTSKIQNYELLFKGSKTGYYLTIEPKEGESVPVAIWQTTAEDEAALDIYEGFPTFYYKMDINLSIKEIQTGKIKNQKCYVYIMHKDRPKGLPSKQYVDICTEGYFYFGFDTEFLEKAIEKSKL